MKECWHVNFNIVKPVNFYTAFLLPELRPAEHCKAEFNRSRIESIDVPSKVEYICNSQSTGLFYHIVGKIFKDTIVPVLVRFCKIVACNESSESMEPSLASVSLYGDYQISKPVTSGELIEHKNFELIPA